MPRFIVRQRGTETLDAMAARVNAARGVRLIERASRMLLVDGSESAVRALVEGDPNWLLVPEEKVPLPDPRPKVRKRAGG